VARPRVRLHFQPEQEYEVEAKTLESVDEIIPILSCSDVVKVQQRVGIKRLQPVTVRDNEQQPIHPAMEKISNFITTVLGGAGHCAVQSNRNSIVAVLLWRALEAAGADQDTRQFSLASLEYRVVDANDMVTLFRGSVDIVFARCQGWPEWIADPWLVVSGLADGAPLSRDNYAQALVQAAGVMEYRRLNGWGGNDSMYFLYTDGFEWQLSKMERTEDGELKVTRNKEVVIIRPASKLGNVRPQYMEEEANRLFHELVDMIKECMGAHCVDDSGGRPLTQINSAPVSRSYATMKVNKDEEEE
jgi:hypothetical protein